VVAADRDRAAAERRSLLGRVLERAREVDRRARRPGRAAGEVHGGACLAEPEDDALADTARGARDERDPILEHAATLADPANVCSFRNGGRSGSVRTAVTTATPILPDALRLGPV